MHFYQLNRLAAFHQSMRLILSVFILGLMAVAALDSRPHQAMGRTQPETTASVLVQSDRPLGRHLFGDWYVVPMIAPIEREAVLAAERLPGVVYAEPDARLKLHQTCPLSEWYIANAGQFGGPQSVGVDTHALAAWDKIHALTSPSPVRIAIVDSGINTHHPRFTDVTFYAEKRFTEDYDEEGDFDPYTIEDVHGHGTAVAGVIVAMLPDPSWYTLGSYRVVDQTGYTTYSVLLQGMQEAVADGAQVINFSGGGRERSFAVYEFLQSHPDVLFIFSAGNKSQRPPDYPAHEDHLPSVISVAAIDQSGALTRFTNTGALLAAPGQYIFTAMDDCRSYPIALCQPAGYGFLNGTSFSAPIVSAICAGRILMHPEESAAEVRRKLLASVEESGSYQGHLAFGRVNFQNLIEAP